MTSWPRSLLIPIAFGVALADPLGAGDAWAQVGPNRLPQTGVPTPTAKKSDGVAEEAKDTADKLPTTPVIPQSKNRRKRFQLLEMDGYFRFRSDWLKNFHLGFNDQGDGGAPFPRSLSCRALSDADECGSWLSSANMRLRLEPTININETTQVFMQIDLLDNLVLGSTPDSVSLSGQNAAGLGAFAGSQVAPQAGENHLTDSILVRRVWAEVETALGHLTFGRQPWHWGVGIYANAGGADPFSGGYDLDSDHGDTVDRLMFRAQIPGTQLDAAVALDWSATYPSSAQDPLVGQGGQPWDIEDGDDVTQWVLMITRFDKPEIFAETMARGDFALNYGGFLAYRTQDSGLGQPEDGGDFVLVERGLKTYTPDVWAKLGTGKLTLEFEGVATFGEIANASDVELPEYPEDINNPDATETVDGALDILRIGAVARLGYKALDDKMSLGFELGYASGDQWDNEQPGATHVSNARRLPVGGDDATIENFMFNPAYQVDMILFRELLGTVTNATYAKPSLSYQITSEIGIRAQGILSFANRPVATPGNGSMYGAEFNGDVSYRKGGFHAGLAYGVLFPLSAMDHPSDGDGGPGYGFGTNVGDATTAQSIQGRLMLRF